MAVRKTKGPGDGLKPGERRVKSGYLPLQHQGGIDPGSIRKMTPADTVGGFHNPQFPNQRIDFSRSMTSTKGGRTFAQPEFIETIATKAKGPGKPKAEVKPVKENVGTLKTRSVRQISTRPANSDIVKLQKRKMVKPEVKPIFKGTVSAQGKLTGKVGNQLRNAPIKRVATAIANVPAKAVFNREQKLAAGYKRADQTMGGTGVKMMNKKEGLATLKAEKGVLKSIKKDKTVDVKSALKDIKLAERYQKRAIKGKIGKYTK